jgi:hypothetical protein
MALIISFVGIEDSSGSPVEVRHERRHMSYELSLPCHLQDRETG